MRLRPTGTLGMVAANVNQRFAEDRIRKRRGNRGYRTGGRPGSRRSADARTKAATIGLRWAQEAKRDASLMRLPRQETNCDLRENAQNKNKSHHDPHGDQRESADRNRGGIYRCGLPIHRPDHLQIEVEAATDRQDAESDQEEVAEFRRPL